MTLVTTSRHPTAQEEMRARVLAAELGVPYVPRRGSLDDLDAEAVLVVTRERLVVHTPAGEIFFHPGMARPRVRELERGKPDVMVQAMGLRPGDTVLDCTLGLGSDAIVASFVVGGQGRVVGLEAVPVLAAVVRWGLQNYDPDHDGLRDAMRRIEVVRADHEAYLSTLPAASFDIVYFDPMFREPVMESAHMRPWRALACHQPLSRATIAAACRVARRRVVVKERSGSPVFAELGLTEVVGGRKSRIAYGVLDAAGMGAPA